MNTLDTPLTFVLEVTRLDVIKLLLPATLGFFVGILITPLITHYMFKYRWWKKKSVDQSVDGRAAPLTKKLHNDEQRKVPRMGGLVVWLSVFIVTAALWLVSVIIEGETAQALNIVSRNQTWMVLVTFLFGTIIGFVDDLIVTGNLQSLSKYSGGGLSVKSRLTLVAILGLVVGWWMYARQDLTLIQVPYIGNFEVALWFMVPFTMFVMMSMYAGSNIDGVDGLSGGVFAIIFSSYAFIAFMQERFDLAALCFLIVGALLAFLWFNIPPARFFMSDTGTMPLTIGLAVVAFLTNTVFLLPIIAFPLVVSIGSVVLQLTSKKFRGGKKILIAAPLHNHLQLAGWPGPKVTMRYWVITFMCSTVGLVIFLTGGYL